MIRATTKGTTRLVVADGEKVHHAPGVMVVTVTERELILRPPRMRKDKPRCVRIPWRTIYTYGQQVGLVGGSMLTGRRHD